LTTRTAKKCFRTSKVHWGTKSLYRCPLVVMHRTSAKNINPNRNP